MRLLRRHALQIVRKTSEGYYNENGRWVSGEASVTVPIRGNLQPYNNSLTQKVLPKGVVATDVRILYTVAQLRTSDEVAWTEADVLLLNDIEYECFSVMDWSQQLARTSHYEYLFIRRDKINQVRNASE